MMLSAEKCESVSLYFVLPSRGVEDCDDEMKMAYQDCLEAGLKPKWVTDEEVVQCKAKTDVIVFEKFEGKSFDFLKKQKCVICGPRCIRVCLAENSQIPETNSPIFMTSMRGLVITATNIDSNEKMKVKEKVNYMGGLYTSNLIETVTHLVCGEVRSVKYDKAAERGIALMTIEWVDVVWREGLKRNILATASEFDVYKCPVFLNLEITTTNLSKSEKDKLKNIVNSHGGTYSGQLKQNSTNVLIIDSNPNSSTKYKHARSWDLTCVKSSWIYESIKRGYAVSSQEHVIVPEVRCSTPTGSKEELPSFMSSDISVVSSIPCPGQSNKSSVEESIVLTNMTVPYNPALAQEEKKKMAQHFGGDQTYKKVVENLNLGDAKKAGPFLDGCKVYLSGFTMQEQDKLRRILNAGGAVIFSELIDAVSHVIAGDFVAADGILISKSINRPHVVGVEWLAASLKQRSPALESLYSRLGSSSNNQFPAEPPSPLSQKGMQLLKKGEFKTPPSVGASGKRKQKQLPVASFESNSSSDNLNPYPSVNRNLFQDFVNDDNVAKSTMPRTVTAENQQPVSERSMDVDTEGCDNDSNFTGNTSEGSTNIFKDLVFMILGFDSDITAQIDVAICKNGGCVVAQSFKGMTDYTIVPIIGVSVTGIQSEIVTPYWIDDCCESKSIVPVLYYHQPIFIAGNRTPLEGCIITLSIYSLRERQFLSELVAALGALSQETFARRTNPNKGVHGNTHLVTPTSGSSKYNAALKWNIPVVTKDWLLACAKLGARTSEQQYLVADKSESSTEKVPKTDAEKSGNNDLTHKFETPQNKSTNPSIQTVATTVTPKTSSSHEINEELVDVVTKDSSSRSSVDMPNKHVTSTSFNSSCVNNLLLPGNLLNTIESHRTDGTNRAFATPKVRKLSVKSTPIRNYDNIATPETPYEEILGETGKTARKRIKRWIDRMEAEKERDPLLTPPTSKRLSTPLSELMRKAFEKFGNTPDNSICQSEKNVDNKSDASLRIEPIENENNELNNGPSSSQDAPVSSFSEELATLNKKLCTPSGTPKGLNIPIRIMPPSINNDRTDIESSSTSSTGSNIRSNPNFDSQKNEIGWEEPIESAEKAKILGNKDPVIRKFVISNVQEHKKNDYIDMINTLGGTLISSDRFSYETTHLLTDRPIRSEKLLCSIAAGRWVLHVSYLEESYKANTFLNEEDFEWGNPKSKENVPPLNTEREINLANAAHRWRTALLASSGDSGAYEGMKAVLFLSNKRLSENITRLILAGKGDILDHKSLLEATHCFVDSTDNADIDFKLLASKNIHCLPAVYLGEYLTESPTPDPAECTVDEYRKYSRGKVSR